MDQYQTDEALKAYERIETAIMQFAEHVPLVSKHESIESPALIPFIVDACSLIDSLFRDMTSDPVTVDTKTKARRDCDISDFAKLHAAALDLPNTRSVQLVSPPAYRMPFEPWQSLLTDGSYSALPWWQNHNSLKHDRLANLRMGTLGTALDAACALHQILSRRLTSFRLSFGEVGSLREIGM